MSIKNIPQSLIDAVKGIVVDNRAKYFEEEQAREKLVAEKMLSPKQKNIAAVAGDPKKIDAADFKALRSGKQMKEETEEVLETSKGKAARYIEKNRDSTSQLTWRHGRDPDEAETSDDYVRKITNRDKGFKRAMNILNKEEVEQIDEISKETKNDFKARQERLAAASAQTAKDPARLARLSKIPGYTAAMDLAKKTTQKEEVEPIDELSKGTLSAYASKSGKNLGGTVASLHHAKAIAAHSGGTMSPDDVNKSSMHNIKKRTIGLARAAARLAREEVEQVDEAVKPLESHDITSLAKMHAQHVLRQEGASVARPKHSFKDVSDTIKKKYGNTVHKLVGLHSENTVDDYTGSIHGSDSHNLRNKINSTLKKNRSSESIQHEPFHKLTRSEFNEERDTPGNGREHQCAIHVKSEQFGEGKTLTTQHADPDEYGNIAWYDVMFEHGIERVITKNLEILVSEAHTHMKKKGVSAGTTAESRDVSTSQRQRQAHQHNLDAAQREIDRREAEGEDMTGARIDPKNYQIIKPKKKAM